MSRTYLSVAVPCRRAAVAPLPTGDPVSLLSRIAICSSGVCRGTDRERTGIRSDGYVLTAFVRTVVRDGDRIYIAAIHSHRGSTTGGAVASDPYGRVGRGSERVRTCTRCPGRIGGWYLGGAFVFVDGAPLSISRI